MIDHWKRVWRETVDSFRQGLHGTGDDGDRPLHDARLDAMRRDIAAARDELRRVEAHAARTRTRLAAEHEREAECRRRAAVAGRIGDEETARIAAEFEKRHGERRTVLARKLDAFEAERELLRREIVRMERAAEQRRRSDASPPAAAAAAGGSTDPATDDDRFERLDRRGREREAEERLEALKRRVRRSG